VVKQPLDRLRSRKKQVTRRVALAINSDLAEKRDRIQSEISKIEVQGRIGMRRGGALPQTDQERLEELHAELNEVMAELSTPENTAWFVVRSLGPKAWEKLCSDHPPTPDQRDQAKKDGIGALAYNTDTFFDDLIPRCVSWVDHDDDTGEEELVPLTAEFVDEMKEGDQWSSGEWFTLCQAASDVNSVVRRVDDLGNVSRRTR
jgi:hypothetical protein